MQNFFGNFLVPAIFAIYRTINPGDGNVGPNIFRTTNIDCYAQYGTFFGPAATFEDMTEQNKVRYFNVFTRKGSELPPPIPIPIYPGASNELQRCWDNQYREAFARITSKVRVNQMFASFSEPHSEALGEMADLLIENIDNADPTNGKIIAFMEYVRNRGDIHPQLFVSAVPIALVATRSNLLGYDTPSLVEMFPSRFLPNIVPGGPRGSNFVNDDQQCVKVNERWGSTKTNGIENRLWYFREDLQLNSHHWNWHQFHATQAPQIPRRGELFYFFHHDLMARYGAERMANGFEDYFVEGVKPIIDYELKQGYDSNLRDGVSLANWVNRVNATKLSRDKLPENIFKTLQQHVTWWNHVDQITRTGQVMDGNNNTVPLMPKPDGINTIGELFEASKWSLNQYFYGKMGWHNAAHNILGSVLMEEDQEEKQEWGVLTDVATAVRDIYFYRIHNEVNNMFMRYKDIMLKPYEVSQGDIPFVVPGIVTRSIRVRGDSHGLINNLTTFWNNHNMILDGGLDVNVDETNPLKLSVCLKHIDHEEFKYNIELENQGSSNRQVFVRLFMAPRYNLNGQRFNLTEQYKLFFAMDAFPVTLIPGANTITRSSIQSVLTKPWFQLTSEIAPTMGMDKERTCSCGYPHHMLLPKGSDDNKGVYDLVALVTDGSDFNMKSTAMCAESWMHCSIIDGDMDYPDSKPMGWPFDRRPTQELSQEMLERLVSQVPNMASTTITIVHDDTQPKEHVI